MGVVRLPRLPDGATPFERELVRVLTEILTAHAQAINQSATGQLSALSAVSDIKPTHEGSPGDTVRNSATTVLGSPGSEYIIDGWRWGAADSVWHEISHLTDG